MNLLRAVAISTGSLGGTIKALSPSTNKSLALPTFVVIIGSEFAAASNKLRAAPSVADGKAKMSAVSVFFVQNVSHWKIPDKFN